MKSTPWTDLAKSYTRSEATAGGKEAAPTGKAPRNKNQNGHQQSPFRDQTSAGKLCNM
jgi:hypothetical protein